MQCNVNVDVGEQKKLKCTAFTVPRLNNVLLLVDNPNPTYVITLTHLSVKMDKTVLYLTLSVKLAYREPNNSMSVFSSLPLR